MADARITKFKQTFQLLFTPVVLILLGLILLINPDSASALIGKLLGWALVLCGAVAAYIAGTTASGRPLKILSAVVLLGAGIWLLKTPLGLAAALGRVVGILIALRGIQDLRSCLQWGYGMPMALVTTVIGILLLLVPMTASRLLMMGCGVLVLLVGIANLMERLGKRRHPESSDDNIIDV